MIELKESCPNLEFIEGDGPVELKKKLDHLKRPFKIVCIYTSGRRHYCWYSVTNVVKRKIIKKQLK